MLHLMKHLHNWIDLKKALAKTAKGATFWKQPLGNILFKIYNFKFIHIASSADINKAITCENDCLPYVCFVLLHLPLALVDLGLLQHLRWSALCDKSQQLEAIFIVTKSSIIYVAGVLDMPLKSTDKSR